jgi:hypothetical protein
MLAADIVAETTTKTAASTSLGGREFGVTAELLFAAGCAQRIACGISILQV